MCHEQDDPIHFLPFLFAAGRIIFGTEERAYHALKFCNHPGVTTATIGILSRLRRVVGGRRMVVGGATARREVG